MSYAHGISAEPLLGLSLGFQFDRVAETYPDNDALVSLHQGARFTYRKLGELVDDLAFSLINLGIQIGDRIGIWSANNWQWVVVQLAAAKTGAILVNINPAYRLPELEYALKQSGVRMLVFESGPASSEYLSMLGKLVPQLVASGLREHTLPELEYLVMIGEDGVSPGVPAFHSLCSQSGARDLSSLYERQRQLQFDQPINIQYTSGTTGFPKGVTLSHHNLLNNALISARCMGLTSSSRFCCPMPFYHCAGMVLSTLTTLFSGGCLVIPNRTFDAEQTLLAVESESCSHLAGVPTMFIAELELAALKEFNLTSLSGGFMAGAPCPVELMRQVANRLHMSQVIIFYGQTEASPVLTATEVSDSLETRATTVGQVVPHTEIKIVDVETREIVPRGAQGEICGRGHGVMLGYWMNPDATHEAVDQSRWLYTGDLGIMHDNGYVNITGRKKDMIIRGGENIYPREVEEVLHAHPDIVQAQLFGVPDLRLGEEVAAWIQLRGDAQVDAAEIVNWLRQKVAYFKVPRHIRFVCEFPMTVTGKVQKHAMRDQMIRELNLETLINIQTA